MIQLLLTIDTELRASAGGNSPEHLARNIDSNIWGRTDRGDFGLSYQLSAFRKARQKAVFFVETLCAEVIGVEALRKIVEPMLADGHEVQLHLHTEWLARIERPPVAYRGRNNIGEFDEAEQLSLIQLGQETLHKVGVNSVSAFRAGNYGAARSTLRALQRAGILYDASYNLPYIPYPCAIDTLSPLTLPTLIDGVVEVPITFFEDYRGHFRHLQLGACSRAEIRATLDDAIAAARSPCTLVSHSFELLNGRHERVNPILVRRFNALCQYLSERASAIRTIGYADLHNSNAQAERGLAEPRPAALDHYRSHVGRTALRVAEQALGRLYG